MENIENKIFGKEDLKEEFLSDLREEISKRLNYCGYDELFKKISPIFCVNHLSIDNNKTFKNKTIEYLLEYFVNEHSNIRYSIEEIGNIITGRIVKIFSVARASTYDDRVLEKYKPLLLAAFGFTEDC